ncbi:FxsA family protein [Salirhabdus salicampi]|uniref:FxsA family protein n=1 Tax=Salirhabdus salicampi TaxID=476102 RepID=UPI0020C1DD99|nr:FxsA family protein [Salirhabdus salicampi]MCP8617098.1 membrane protein FxsA [Salirhabdus salicampi]
MFRWLFLLIVVISALEIWLFILLGNITNVWVVLSGIILTGIIGAFLAKQQGLDTLRRAQNQLAYGRSPSEQIFDGICILIGAVLLFTPGFITDGIGFLLLIPYSRKLAKNWMKQTLRQMMNRGTVTVFRRWK